MQKLLVLAAVLGVAFVAAPESAKAGHGYGGGGYGGGSFYGGGYGHHHDCGPYGGFRQPRLHGGYYGGYPYGSLSPYGYSNFGYRPYGYPRQGLYIQGRNFGFGYYR